MTYKKTYNPCDECNYSYSKNNEESNMCKICEFKELVERDYSKDYLLGMRHLADAVKYELDKKHYHFESKARNCDDIDAYRDYTNIAGGIETAVSILDKVLTMQLEVKGEE